jgi:hypothetical protein
VRGSKVLIAAVCAGGLLVPGAAAQAAARHPVSSVLARCPARTLRIPFTGVIATASRAGQQVTAAMTIKSGTSLRLRRVFFDYELDSPVARRHPAPVMAWRLGHGRWHPLPLPHWTPANRRHGAFWETNDTVIGPIAPHSRHTLRFRLAFRRRDHPGIYSGQAAFGSATCDSGHQIIGFGEAGFAFRPQPAIAATWATRGQRG